MTFTYVWPIMEINIFKVSGMVWWGTLKILWGLNFTWKDILKSIGMLGNFHHLKPVNLVWIYSQKKPRNYPFTKAWRLNQTFLSLIDILHYWSRTVFEILNEIIILSKDIIETSHHQRQGYTHHQSIWDFSNIIVIRIKQKWIPTRHECEEGLLVSHVAL